MVFVARGGPPKMQPSFPAPQWAPLDVWVQLDACPTATTLLRRKTSTRRKINGHTALLPLQADYAVAATNDA